MLVSLALVVLSAGDPPESREERILALLQDVARSGCYRYAGACFEEVAPRLGDGPVLVARIDSFCGNTDSGTFDDVAARKIASECMDIFGFEVVRDHLLQSGERSVQLDGVDVAARIGFELVGRGCRETFCKVESEAPETNLDPGDAKWLAAQGYRLHVADVADYRGHGDELTPTLAYIAGLVRFLNSVTEGEDVILDGLLFEREGAWEIPRSQIPWASTDRYGSREIVANQPETIQLRCAGTPDLTTAPLRHAATFHELPEASFLRRELATTAVGPSVLLLHGEALNLVRWEPKPMFRVRLRQTLDGVERTQEGAALALFLPREFDLTRPFEVELELSPGRYVFIGPVRIGGCAPE